MKRFKFSLHYANDTYSLKKINRKKKKKNLREKQATRKDLSFRSKDNNPISHCWVWRACCVGNDQVTYCCGALPVCCPHSLSHITHAGPTVFSVVGTLLPCQAPCMHRASFYALPTQTHPVSVSCGKSLRRCLEDSPRPPTQRMSVFKYFGAYLWLILQATLTSSHCHLLQP